MDDYDSSDELSNIPDITQVKFTVKETYIFKQIDKFLKALPKEKITKMVDIMNKDSNLSLRNLDCFVTRYSNKYKIRYKLSNGEYFNVHIGYKAQLKSFTKKYFDPFRRGKKFVYKLHEYQIGTTIGQLNFFKWVFNNEIIEYIENNYKIVSDALVVINKEDKEKRKQTTDSDDDETEDTVTSAQKKSKSKNKVVAKKTNIKISATHLKNIQDDENIKIILSFDD